jgi:hypothetical protein
MKHFALLFLLAGAALPGCNDHPSNTDQGMTPHDQGTPPDRGVPDDEGVPDDGGITSDNGLPQDQGIDEDSSAPVCVASQVGAGAQNVAICPLENSVRHVRIVGLTAARAHASTQLFLGLTDAAGPQAALTAGQFKLQLYGGGQPQPPPDLGAYFGPDSVGFEGPHDFINAVSTICLDVHPGSASTRAAVVLWLDGQHGADCEDRSTLTFANRYGHVWAPNSGALDDDGVYFYQSGGTQTPVVTLSDTPAVAYEDVPPPDCTVTDLSASPTARYVALCELDAPVRHVRITGLMTEAMHGTVSFLVGYPAPANTGVGPVGPGAGQLRAQFYIGGPRLDVGFHGAATQATGDYAFLSTASTVCFDIHDGGEATPPYFVLWRDGVNEADCEDSATLTAANAFAVVNAFEDGAMQPVVGALDHTLPSYLYLYRSAAPGFGSGNASAVWLSTTAATTAGSVAPVL